jgi:competence protein ComEC
MNITWIKWASAVVGCGVLYAGAVNAYLQDHRLKVMALNVGEGDAVLIETPYKQRIVIDTGPGEAAAYGIGMASLPFARDIALLVLSHPDADHIGGAAAIIRSFAVQRIITLEQEKVDTGKSAVWRMLWDMVTHIPPHPVLIAPDRRMTVTLDHTVTLSLAMPALPEGKVTDYNSYSVAALLTYRGRTFLFAGDAPAAEEDWIAGQIGKPVDVLKVSHHGSKYSTADDFLARIVPHAAVVSVGKNTFGHPAPETMARLAAHRIPAYRTDQEGTMVFFVDSAITLNADCIGFFPLCIRRLNTL